MMTSRPVRRGHLRLAPVFCPVALHTANLERAWLHVHFINPATGHRVRMATMDAETGEEVSRRGLTRGYEFRKDTRLILTDKDFEQAVAIMPLGCGLVQHTLHETGGLADPAELFAAVPASRPAPEWVKPATQLIDRQTGPTATRPGCARESVRNCAASPSSPRRSPRRMRATWSTSWRR